MNRQRQRATEFKGSTIHNCSHYTAFEKAVRPSIAEYSIRITEKAGVDVNRATYQFTGLVRSSLPAWPILILSPAVIAPDAPGSTQPERSCLTNPLCSSATTIAPPYATRSTPNDPRPFEKRWLDHLLQSVEAVVPGTSSKALHWLKHRHYYDARSLIVEFKHCGLGVTFFVNLDSPSQKDIDVNQARSLATCCMPSLPHMLTPQSPSNRPIPPSPRIDQSARSVTRSPVRLPG